MVQQIWPVVNSFLLDVVILFLLTAGFFLIHRTARFLNIAHTDYATLGAYLMWTISSPLGWNPWLALVIAVIAIGLIAILIDQVSYRYLRGAPLALLLCSIGVALVVRYSIFMTWGEVWKNVRLAVPGIQAGGVGVSGSLLLGVGFTAAIMLAMYLFLNRTRLGVGVRAMADNRALAESFGIDTERTLKYVWFIAGGSATLGGLILALYRPLTSLIGFNWILLVVGVSILAGERVSFFGLLAACAIIAGGIELGLFFIPEAYRMGLGFAILIIVIVVRRALQR